MTCDLLNYPETPNGNTGEVKSALRVINILELLARWSSARTHIQIAEELNIPKSSLTQILKTLVRHCFLKFDPDTRGYSLGTAIQNIAEGAHLTEQLTNVATEVLKWLTQQTGESSALNMREGDNHLVAATMLSQQSIVAHLRLGDKAPLHATSGGQVILAYLPHDQLDGYLSRARFELFAKNSLPNERSVRDKLKLIRTDGFSKVVDEFTPGIGGIARPILDKTNCAVASLSITVPSERLSDELKEIALVVLEKAVTSLRHRMKIT
jgi:DNA-binding IclR family transcriptional regulator